MGSVSAQLSSGADQQPPSCSPSLRHLVWVWQFTTDAEPNIVGARLLEHGLGIILKTHDGMQWMCEYDKSPYAVSGPAQVGVLANYFETAGVPFHAWCVLHGVDPMREAQMAAEVLDAGARSVYLDIEPHSGFWRGTPRTPSAFGKELRRLAPERRVVALDRPAALDGERAADEGIRRLLGRDRAAAVLAHLQHAGELRALRRDRLPSPAGGRHARVPLRRLRPECS